MKTYFSAALAFLFGMALTAQEQMKKEPTTPEETEIWEPKPEVVHINANSGVPSDAVILFDGSNFDAWEHVDDSRPVEWELDGKGAMIVKDQSGDIRTKQRFGSVQLHLEWRSNPENKKPGQNRSNSGIFLQDRYEVQILDNNDNDTYVNGMVGSIYKQNPPLVMAARPTGQWNTYDIIFQAPQFDEKGEKTRSGNITVLFNGVLVQNHYVLKGSTEYIGWPKNVPHGDGSIILQDHKDQSGVAFRNIWLREL